MKLPITNLNKVDNPLEGFGFAFIDEEDKKLKVKKHDSVIEFNNDLSDIQLLDLTDYTAFEVFAHDYDIPVGECEELGGYVSQVIPANMTHMMAIRTLQPNYAKSDIVIDWGDGTTSTVAEGEFEQGVWASTGHDPDAGELNYNFIHRYEATGKYIIKIYGKQYYNIQHILLCEGEGTKLESYWTSNLMCRVFTEDLPLANHLRHLAHFCSYGQQLIHVSVEAIKYFYFPSIDNCFYSCRNLLTATGFKRYFTRSNCTSTFYKCDNLTKSDLQFPIDSVVGNAGRQTYGYCYKLTGDVSSFIPEVNRATRLEFRNFFQNCAQLTGTVPADRLWNSPYIEWINTAGAFQRMLCGDQSASS